MPIVTATSSSLQRSLPRTPIRTAWRWTPWHTRVTVAAIVLIALLLRFWGLDREGQWADEYFQTSQYSAAPQYVVYGARANNQPPLDFLLGWVIAHFGSSTWLMRAPAALFGTAGVLALFALTRRLISTPAAVAAAALLTVSPLHFKLSQEARPYAIFVLALLIMLILMLRAIEKPTRGRMAALLVSQYLMTLTRGLAPLVVLLTLWLVLTAHLAFAARTNPARRALVRTWMSTTIAGLAAIPMVLFLVIGDQEWSMFAGGTIGAAGSFFQHWMRRLPEDAATWLTAPRSFFGDGVYLLVPLAVLGVVQVFRRWHAQSITARVCWGFMVAVGPVYLLTFSATVAESPINHRYALFLAPLCMIFAARGLTSLVELVALLAHRPVARRLLPAAIVLAVYSPPAWSTVIAAQRYYYPDWRGSAWQLADTIGSDDVVMVFFDRPLGECQPPYWGKYDWPDPNDRPLGESAWTLATSEPHWQRLIRKTGRCYIAIRYPVNGQSRDAYRRLGLQSVEGGLKLIKFRGLDFLYRPDLDADLIDATIAACNNLLDLALKHDEARAILLTLRSRLEYYQGRTDAACASYRAAREYVSQEKLDWFNNLTQAHRASLHAVCSDTGSMPPDLQQ